MKPFKNNIRKILRANVIALRTEKGWSQEYFVFDFGLHWTYIGTVEVGESNISLGNIENIIDKFRINITEPL